MMKRFAMLLALGLCAAPLANAQAPVRLPPLDPASHDTEQKQAAEAFQAARKAPMTGPFLTMMRSPVLMSAVRGVGDYLRFGSAIGTTLSEFVILVTAREWGQDYEWNTHKPIALTRGISAATIDAIADGRRPEAMTADEALCYDFVIDLIRTKRVSDPTYARAAARFGEKGVVDLTGIAGYYSLLAMQLNVARTDPGAPYRLPRFPD